MRKGFRGHRHQYSLGILSIFLAVHYSNRHRYKNLSKDDLFRPVLPTVAFLNDPHLQN